MRLTINARLLGGFSFFILFSLAATLVALNSLNGANTRLVRLVDVDAQKALLSASINLSALAISREEKNIILANTQSDMDEVGAKIDELQRAVRDERQQLYILSSDDEKAQLDQMEGTWGAYMKVNKELRTIAHLNSNVRAKNLSQGDASEAYKRAAATMEQLLEKNTQDADQAQDVGQYRKVLERLKLSMRINHDLVEIQRGEKNLILSTNQKAMDEYAVTIERDAKDIERGLDQLEKLVEDEGKFLVKRFNREYQSYYTLHKRVRKLSRENTNVRAYDLSRGAARELNDKALAQMAAIVDTDKRQLVQDKLEAERDFNNYRNLLLAIVLCGLVLGIILAAKIVQAISKGLGQISSVLAGVALGDTREVVEVTTHDEIGDVLHQINKMVVSLQEVTEVSQLVAKKDFSTSIKVKSARDVMGQSLNTMIENLREFTQESEQATWLKGGLNELNIQMLGELDEVELADRIMQFLANYLSAQVGTLYLWDEASNDAAYGHAPGLKLVGSYAFSQRTELNARIELGVGLVGQAAYEKKLISVTQLPEEYTRIGSSIGAAMPRNTVVIPFLSGPQIIGVVELGAFEEFSALKLDLLKSAMESIALAFVAARSRQKTIVLLADSQRQGEELRSQQEELQESNQELEEQTQMLKSSEEELKQQSEELKASNEELEEKSVNLHAQRARIEAQKTELEAGTLHLEQQAKDLQLANQYKSEFLSNMSHELRTPLNSMLLLTESLVDNKEGNLSAAQIEAARIIYSGGKELTNLISEVLDLSKIEAGKMQLTVEKINLEHLLGRLGKQFGPVAKDNKLDFETIIEPGLISEIQSDAQRLQQILKNLLSNAFKFTEKGSVKLQIRSVAPGEKLSVLDPGHQQIVALSVSDTGVGIPEAKRSIIFESFQQAEGSISRNYGGTGLGLTISRELTKLLGGELVLERSTETEAETGCTFTLYLPTIFTAGDTWENKVAPVTTSPPIRLVASPAVMEHREGAPFFADDRAVIAPGDRSLLIIEDDVLFAGSLANLARSRGFKCLVTDRGLEGVLLAQQQKPSAIVLDLGLPDADGVVILDQLKDNLKTRHIPIHIVSARDPEPTILQKGAVGYLTKPVTSADLEELLSKLQDRSEPRVKQILIVEDDADSQAAIADLINYQGVELTMANTGEEALERLASDSYDCVILDLRLPGLSGVEVLEHLSSTVTGPKPPVIVYTGADLTPEQNRQLEVLAKSVVIKGPGSGDRLIDDLALFLHSVEKDLPAHHREAIQSLHNPQRVLEGRTVLIVDDDFRNVLALSKVLAEAGLDIQSADNGKLALDKLASDPDIDLVIMDIMMPVMDGLEAMRHIRAQAHLSQLPIIALTAKATPEDRENCLAAGASDYVSKPVSSEQILTLLRLWLHRASA